jgi:iron(III) transport system substrate-binding protein
MFIQKIARWGLLSWSCWIGLVLSEGPVSGVVPPSSGHEQIFLNRAQDRLVSTLEKAKKEGTLTLYTSMAPSEIGPLVKEFEKKYALKVEVWRSTSEGILQRALNESKAKKFNFDVVETNAPEVEILARERTLAEFYSPHQSDLPQNMSPKHKLWVPDRINFYVVAFNTNKIKREDLPTHLEGFTHPKWRDKLGLEATDGDWMGTVVNELGEARGLSLFKKLSELKPDVRKGHNLLAQMVSNGEVPVGLTTYLGNAQSLKQRGAPVDWVPIEPVIARAQGLGLSKYAPHPHAALLFADFLISPEAQTILNSLGRPPANINIKSKLNNFNYVVADPMAMLDEADKWNQIWNKMFLVK